MSARRAPGRARAGGPPPRAAARAAPRLDIHFGDNLPLLRAWPAGSFHLVYLDPPFNTGRRRTLTRLRTERDDAGDRTGFQGRRYRSIPLGTRAFADHFPDYLAFLEPRLEQARRLLAPTGSLLLHLDCREVHYAKVLLDAIFGRASFRNEIVWAYDYGGRPRDRWPAKHDHILWYAKDPRRCTFRRDAIDRIPYLAPGLVTPEKAARGKIPTDVWWHTIVSPTGRERTGYPAQKPLAILDRLVRVHARPGERVLDGFAGSGTTGEAAVRNGCHAVLVDSSPQAMRVMARRLAFARPVFHGWPRRGPVRRGGAAPVGGRRPMA